MGSRNRGTKFLRACPTPRLFLVRRRTGNKHRERNPHTQHARSLSHTIWREIARVHFLAFRPKTGEGAGSDAGTSASVREFSRCTKANHTVARLLPLLALLFSSNRLRMCPALASWGAVESGEASGPPISGAQAAGPKVCLVCYPKRASGCSGTKVARLVSFPSISPFPARWSPSRSQHNKRTQQSQVSSMLPGFDVGIRRRPEDSGLRTPESAKAGSETVATDIPTSSLPSVGQRA